MYWTCGLLLLIIGFNVLWYYKIKVKTFVDKIILAH